jgi:hypothetical protein
VCSRCHSPGEALRDDEHRVTVVLIERHHRRHADRGHAGKRAHALLERRIEHVRAGSVVACQAWLKARQEHPLGAESRVLELGLERSIEEDCDGQQDEREGYLPHHQAIPAPQA